MANELTLFENKIRKKEHNLFPIQAKHREELRARFVEEKRAKQIKINELREEKILALNKKYAKEIKKGESEFKKEIESYNKELRKKVLELNEFVNGDKPEYVGVGNNYRFNEFIRGFKDADPYNQLRFTQSKNYAKVLIDEKASNLRAFFEKLNEEINKLHTSFDEAVLYGDLDTAREIYYTMKNSDKYIQMAKEAPIE